MAILFSEQSNIIDANAFFKDNQIIKITASDLTSHYRKIGKIIGIQYHASTNPHLKPIYCYKVLLMRANGFLDEVIAQQQDMSPASLIDKCIFYLKYFLNGKL